MSGYAQTKLWQNTLAPRVDDAEGDKREKLRLAYEKFRERAKILAGEINRNLPEFTVHDINHIDALWEMAQLIAGDNYILTPTEAFVLGGAFLIHDLGMGLAAYPRGLDDLKTEKLWQDTVARALRTQHDRTPTPEEMLNPPHDVEKWATGVLLRDLHAKQAEKLAHTSWRDSSGTEYYLIDDPELRRTYGAVIGQIAHSHWWKTEELVDKLPRPLGAPGGYSGEWTVDPVKLACLLRAADATHLDDRRAPGFLRALRQPRGLADQHWAFQNKLYQPYMEGNRLVYTSKEVFPLEESAAWWLCFDALQMVDRELRQVDTVLAESKRPQFEARAVSYVEEARRLAEIIKTDGWLPVDTRIRVGDVASLVSKLGGKELYGDDAIVPLRELIQNASDAVRARRMMDEHPDDWGDVTVRYGDDEIGRWIEVEDTGIGMSEAVLTGPFLDFGTSFWGTPLMHSELPGLESKGFEATGRYGIGFFSVFMWGDKVQVITRRVEKGREDTLVLDFKDGLASRPILRKAQPKEQMKDGGTRVRVWLKERETFTNG